MTPVASETLSIALSHQSLLRISGADAEKFLQGQVTCDIRRLNDRAVLSGAHCDHKGRMQSSFVAARLADGSVGLRLHASIAETACAALKKYAVFSKVELSVADDTAVLAVMGPNAVDALTACGLDTPAENGQFICSNQAVILRHASDFYELWATPDHFQLAQQTLEEHSVRAHRDRWDLAQIELGLGQVREETVGEFIPQMLNFQAVGGISFNKGCYTGQEVVARMHYLGKLKKHMYRADATTQDIPAPGTEVFHAEGESAVGTIVMAAPHETTANVHERRVAVLFVCAEQALDAPLCIASSSGPRLELQPLPYSLD